MATAKFPGEDGPVTAHLQFLLDAMNHVANSTTPEMYRQIPHGDGAVIGDPHKPAMLNASYPHYSRHLLSVSMPMHVDFEKDFEIIDSKSYKFQRNEGLTKTNVADSLVAVLKNQGIYVDSEDMKIGRDALSRTNYIETNTNAADYPRAKAMIDVITRGAGKTPEQLLEQLKSVDQNGRIHSPHYIGPNVDVSGKPVNNDVAKPSIQDHQRVLAGAEPTHTAKGIYIGVGEGPEKLAQYKDALAKAGYVEGKDFTTKPSSLNQGREVISFSGEAGVKFGAEQAELRASGAHLQTPKTPAAIEPIKSGMPEHQRVLAGAEPTHTAKGIYIGVGEGPEKLAQYKDALARAGYVEGKDFTTKPSSLNQGREVISFSGEAGVKFGAEHESFKAAGVHLATPHAQSTTPAAPAAAQPKPTAPVDFDLNEPAAKPAQQPSQSSSVRASASIKPNGEPAAAAVIAPAGRSENVPPIPKHAEQAIRFNSESRIDANERIAYGYKDGGRQAQYGDEMKTVIGTRIRESIEVKSPADDPVLKKAIDFAKLKTAGMKSTEQKANFLSQYVGELLHIIDPDTNTKILKTIPGNENGKGHVSLGQLIEAETGVCRHRSLLFKVLADETGVPSALVRGHFQGPRESGAHAWNEVPLGNGKTLLVDSTHGKVMHMDDDYARQYHHLNKRPMYDSNGFIDYKAQQPATAKPSAPAQPAIQEHHRILAGAEPTHTGKGVYIGVGEGPEKLAQYKDALAKAGYVEGKDFTTKPSSLNNGKDVISFSGEAGVKFGAEHESLKAAGAHLATPVAAPSAQPTPAPATPPPKAAAPVAAPVDLDLSEPAVKPPAPPAAQQPPAQPAAQSAQPQKPAAAAPVDIDLGKPVTPQSAMDDSAARAREQLARQNAEKPQHHLDRASENARAQLAGVGGATGAKVDAKLGKAAIAAEAATHLASGDVAGAVESTAKAVATQAAIKTGVGFVAKRIPGIGAVVTIGMTLWSAGAEAAQGNYKKAGAELLAGSAEAAGNVVGFGGGDLMREIARGGIIAAGGPAAEKSQLRQAGENIIAAGKTVADKAKFGSMDQKSLASGIAADPALHKTINRGGVATPLADALKDKDFRNQYVKTLQEQTASGQYDRSSQIAMIKAYGEKVDASTPAQAVASPAKPAAPATAAATPPSSPAAAAQQVAQYKGMGTAELGRAIQKDDVLPDKVKIGGKDVDLADALKDKGFRQEMLKNMEAAQSKGSDLSTQIAMIKAYGDKLDNDQRKSSPVMAANKPAPSVTAPMA